MLQVFWDEGTRVSVPARKEESCSHEDGVVTTQTRGGGAGEQAGGSRAVRGRWGALGKRPSVDPVVRPGGPRGSAHHSPSIPSLLPSLLRLRSCLYSCLYSISTPVSPPVSTPSLLHLYSCLHPSLYPSLCSLLSHTAVLADGSILLGPRLKFSDFFPCFRCETLSCTRSLPSRSLVTFQLCHHLQVW